MNFHIFYVTVDSDPEAEFALEIWIISTSLYLAVSVSLRAFGRISYFLREGVFEDPRAGSHWKSGQYFIMSFMAVFMAARRFDGVFRPFWPFFRAPPGSPGVERHFFGALDGEEFFAIEGSHAN